MAEREATTESGRQLQQSLGRARWRDVVVAAELRASIYAAVTAEIGRGVPRRQAIKRYGRGTHRSTFAHWRRAVEAGVGPLWERLLDRRVTPETLALPAAIRQIAAQMRRTNCEISCEDARQALTTTFGPRSAYSNTWLRRVWAADRWSLAAGEDGRDDVDLRLPAPPRDRAVPARKLATGKLEAEADVVLHGGAGLALLAAADAETGASVQLARSIQELGEQVSPPGQRAAQRDPTAGRDDEGRFTAAYNSEWRQGLAAGESDGRWQTDETKVAEHGLGGLRVLQVSEMTLGRKLLAIGMTPLVTERRGFDGLAGPAGGWLAVLGGAAYMPATLDKALSELGLLDADAAMWPAHARQWHAQCVRWNGERAAWLRTAVYIDGTADPYWTRSFAKSGPVSRVGRVMPCVTRVALNSGAGVPLLVETHMGAISLRKRLIPMLAELDAAVGPQAGVNRLTVVDSEAGTGAMLLALHEQTQAIFIIPIKGSTAKGVALLQEGAWQGYRERDQVRDVEFSLSSKDVPVGTSFRGVQVQRQDGRHPTTTLLATNAAEDEMPPAQVADEYLARWPRQEQVFRNGRDGGGLDRSHGYGRGEVQHVAVVKKRAKAERSKTTADKRLDKAQRERDLLAEALKQVPAAARKAALKLADDKIRSLERSVQRRTHEQAQQVSMPDTIQVRDGGRDSVATCCKLMVLALLEHVLREYFGGLGLQWRSFIEDLVALPVTMVESPSRCLYRIAANPRQPERTEQLGKAVAEINRRGIRRGEQVLQFEIVMPDGGGP